MNTYRITTVRASRTTATASAGTGTSAIVHAHLLTAENGNRTVTITDGNRTLRLVPDQAARLASAILRAL